MASFEKLVSKKTGKTCWRARVRCTGTPDLSATFSRLTDAKHWAAQTEASIKSGKYLLEAESKRRNLNDVLDLYEPEILQRLKDPFNRIEHLTYWRSKLGPLTLEKVRPHVIKPYREALRENLSNATTNRYLASLSAALTYAVKELEWLKTNPCLNIKRLKEPKGRKRFLSEQERHNLLAACQSLTNYPELTSIVLLAMTTGMRRSEILTLKWRDINFKTLRIVIWETKNNETRTVPLVGPARIALKHWAKVRPLDGTALVFPSHVLGKNNRPFDIDHAWCLAKKHAALEDFRFHDLRHTAASYLAMSGAGIREIGDILGHKTLSMVQRYSHLTEDHKCDTVTRMVQTVFGGQQ
jgi:integrase